MQIIAEIATWKQSVFDLTLFYLNTFIDYYEQAYASNPVETITGFTWNTWETFTPLRSNLHAQVYMKPCKKIKLNWDSCFGFMN